MAAAVNRRIRLRDDVLLLAVGGQIFNVFRDAAILDLAVRRFEKTEFVDARERRERRDEADVRAFRRLNRADAPVMRRMNVADFKARAVAGKTARPEGRQAALVGQFGQRIDLVHELAQLRAAKEIADDRRKRLRIDEFLRRHRLDALVEQRHALLDEAFGARETDAALVGEQFADRADAAAAEMVNVVHAALALFEAEQIFGRGHQIVLGQNARAVLVLEAELLVDLVTADAAQIVALGIEEQPLEQRAGVGGGRRIARTQPAVNVLERLFLVLGRVFLEALDDDAFVHGRVHDLDLGHAEFGDLLDHRLGQRLERARNHQAFLRVHGVLDQNAVRQTFELLGFLDREFLDFVEQLQDFLVRAADRAAVVLRL